MTVYHNSIRQGHFPGFPEDDVLTQNYLEEDFFSKCMEKTCAVDNTYCAHVNSHEMYMYFVNGQLHLEVLYIQVVSFRGKCIHKLNALQNLWK